MSPSIIVVSKRLDGKQCLYTICVGGMASVLKARGKGPTFTKLFCPFGDVHCPYAGTSKPKVMWGTVGLQNPCRGPSISEVTSLDLPQPHSLRTAAGEGHAEVKSL